MINIRTKREIEILRKAGELTGETHNHLKKFIKVGITTNELDKIAYKFIKDNDAEPSFLNYGGFPKSICTSINEEVVHGIPKNRKLKDGDIISIDIGVKYKGYHGDSAWTYVVGKETEDSKYLLKHTEEALFKGLSRVKEGAKVGDIGYEIEKYANSKKLGVVRELIGHGVGSNLHEAPDIPNYGKEGTGPTLKAGMILAIEPMLNLGDKEVCMLDDDWTVVTGDNKPSAHFEHTVLVTKDGYEILTKR
jgi:methionine aminopeptidase, type I